MANNRNRVVVQVVDADDVATPLRKTRCTFTVHIADRNTLTTTLKNPGSLTQLLTDPKDFRNIRFDCVSGSDDRRLRGEYTMLMDHLIIANENCCLMSFIPATVCQLPFLCHLLVTEVDQRLQFMHGSLNKIIMEYYDVRKYDMASMLSKQGKSGPRNNVQFQQTRLGGAAGGGSDKRKTFNSTLELLNWLQSEYPHLWTLSQGHECFDFELHFTNNHQKAQVSKFTLMQIYSNRMDGETKALLIRYLESVTNKQKRAPKSCMLIDCMREYFAESSNCLTVMLFHLYVINCGDVISEDILKMACAAVNIRSRFESDYSLTTAMSEPETMHNSAFSLSKLKGFGKSTKSKSTHRLKSLNNRIVKPSSSALELNSLSYWYCQMDDKYSKVIAAMEEYYDRVYNIKTNRLCRNINYMMKTIDDEKALQDVPQSDEGSEFEENAKRARQRYNDLVMGFRKLREEIERSNFGDILKVYLKTKSLEMEQHAFQCKEKHLEHCQQQISNVIRNELSALSSLKKASSIRSISAAY